VYIKHVYNVRVCSFYYIKWRHLVNLLPLDNAILKLKHNGLLTLILKWAASSDLSPVDYAVWGALQEMVYHYRSFNSVQELKSAQQLTVTSDSWPKYRWMACPISAAFQAFNSFTIVEVTKHSSYRQFDLSTVSAAETKLSNIKSAKMLESSSVFYNTFRVELELKNSWTFLMYDKVKKIFRQQET